MSDVIVLAYGTRPQVIKGSVLRPGLQRLGPVVSVDSVMRGPSPLCGWTATPSAAWVVRPISVAGNPGHG